MSTHEVVIALSWLNTTLTGDATLSSLAPGGVYRALAEPIDNSGNPIATPYVVFGLQSPGNDTLTANAVRLLTNPLYQVKAVGPSSATEAVGLAASEIDDLLKRTAGSVTGGLVSACFREQPLELDELVNGEQFINIGGLYRLQIQQTT